MGPANTQAKKDSAAPKSHHPHVCMEDGITKKSQTKSTAKQQPQRGGPANMMYVGGSMSVNEDDFLEYTTFRILDSIGYPGILSSSE